MAYVAAAAAVVGAGYSIYSNVSSSKKQAKAIELQSKYQTEQLKRNAAFAEDNAADAIERGDIAIQDYQKETKKVIGAQRAAIAAQGIEVDSGSAASIQTDTAYVSGLDVARIKANAINEAYGYKKEAQNYRSQIKYAKKGALNNVQNTLMTGRNNAYASLFQGVGQVAQIYSGNYGSK